MNIVEMQKTVSGLPDATISKALSAQDLDPLSTLTVMMEKAARDKARRSAGPSAPRTSMLDEMRMQEYQPVPEPPVEIPEVEEPNASIAQQPNFQNPSSDAGLGAIFRMT